MEGLKVSKFVTLSLHDKFSCDYYYYFFNKVFDGINLSEPSLLEHMTYTHDFVVQTQVLCGYAKKWMKNNISYYYITVIINNFTVNNNIIML